MKKVKFSYRFILLIFNAFFLNGCDSLDDNVSQVLTYYITDVHALKVEDMEGRRALILNSNGCSSCFSLNPSLFDQLSLDYLIIVGNKNDVHDLIEKRDSFQGNLLLDKEYEYLDYKHGLGKPVMLTVLKGNLHYKELEDEVYENFDF